MKGFTDETVVEVASGKGGNGVVSFRREKYVPRGGPDGGDGGRGGDVVFAVRRNLKTLSHLRGSRSLRAENGRPGSGKNRHGRDGETRLVEVPPGTVVRRLETDEVLRDLRDEGESWTCLRGGRGGRGNWRFRGPTRQAPRFAEPGEPGQRLKLRLELRLIAEVGLVGMPNAGKSTLLSVLTRARPKIAAYAFTTLIPNLGVMSVGESEVVIADIPGIIEGASDGAGLGAQFLRHVSRSAVLLYLADAAQEECVRAIATVREEVRRYNAELLGKRSIIVATKLDLEGGGANLDALRQAYPEHTVHGVSAVTGAGIGELKLLITDLVRESA